jgi:hypothetical protein
MRFIEKSLKSKEWEGTEGGKSTSELEVEAC